MFRTQLWIFACSCCLEICSGNLQHCSTAAASFRPRHGKDTSSSAATAGCNGSSKGQCFAELPIWAIWLRRAQHSRTVSRKRGLQSSRRRISMLLLQQSVQPESLLEQSSDAISVGFRMAGAFVACHRLVLTSVLLPAIGTC